MTQTQRMLKHLYNQTVKLKNGDTRKDGYRFKEYDKNGWERWLSQKAWNRHRIRMTLNNAKRRAAANGWDFDLDVEHLLSIFPASGVCPLSKELMVWGSEDGVGNSPSIDRIDWSKGYEKGNVWFISHRENVKKAAYEKVLPPWLRVYTDDEETRTEFDWRIDRPDPPSQMEQV